MKRVFFVASVFMTVIACSKMEGDERDEKERPCQAIDKSLVPAVVLSAFHTKYPSDTVITWLRKDSVGYCAYFIQLLNLKKMAEFTSVGIFVSLEEEKEQNGNFEDSTGSSSPKDSSVCECEIPE